MRVHEEVRLYGMVVDPGCMKCMDCVSVCPKGALSFSFAKPSLFKKKRPAAAPAKRYDLPLAEELGVAAVALVSTLAFRDLYNGPPLLMSSAWRPSRPSSRSSSCISSAGPPCGANTSS